ncbi:MAG TPA: hypothetical protein VMO47_12655, partial [Rhodothermales bacterium]|nr:hypothetical protein [Rhodothermales bacterium]
KAGCSKADAGDAECQLRLLAVALESVADPAGAWRRVDLEKWGHVKTLSEATGVRFALRINESENVALKTWITKGRGSEEKRLTVISMVHWAGNVSADASRLAHDIEAVKNASTDLERIERGTEVVKHLIDVLGASMVGGEQPIAWDLIGEVLANLQRRDYSSFLVSLAAMARDLGMTFNLPTRVDYYASLITALTGAKNEQQLSAAFERYAMAVGGWRGKRAAKRMGVVTAFVGIGGGNHELSASVPVGLDITWTPAPGEKEFFDSRPLGVFVSVLDFGAPTARALNGKSTDDEYEWEQIVSPGIYLRYSILGPFVIGAGGALRPDLEDEAGGSDFVGNFFLGFDLSLFPVW